LAEGRTSEAVLQLSSVAAPPDLKAFHAYYLGEGHFYAQDKVAAAADFARAAELGTRPWLQRRAKMRQGEALLASGNAREALALLEPAASEAHSPELYYERGLARARSGDWDGARADFKTIAVRFPAHPCAPLALSQASASPAGPLHFTLDERLGRAKALVESGEPSRALDELASAQKERLIDGPRPAARAALIRAAALYAQGRDAEAEAQLRLTARGEPYVAADGLMARARRALRANQNELARQYMAQIERRYPAEPTAEEAGYFLGWIDLQSGRFAAAVKSFATFERRHPHSRRQDEAIWFESLALLLQRDFDAARARLERLVRQFPNSTLVPQARYWAARTHQLKRENPELPAADYEQLIRQFPGSFYAQLAAARLRELGKEPPVPFPQPPKSPEESPAPELALARALSEAGLARDASVEMADQVEAVRNPADALRLGHALQQLGDYGRAYALAARVLWSNAYTNKEGEALALLYPRAYRATVEQLAKEQQVDAHLIWSIMRRESTFRAEVTSSANARGLMQVFPPTAVQISKHLAMDAPDPDELFSADLNLKFAAWYLAQLVARFGHPALCAAAYNAGPTAVSRWLSERGDLPLDLFVERIPYKQTRSYVKQVVADYVTYRQLYGSGKGDPSVDLALPSRVEAGINF
jgi:soluble lytic murein transglycosylase